MGDGEDQIFTKSMGAKKRASFHYTATFLSDVYHIHKPLPTFRLSSPFNLQTRELHIHIITPRQTEKGCEVETDMSVK